MYDDLFKQKVLEDFKLYPNLCHISRKYDISVHSLRNWIQKAGLNIKELRDGLTFPFFKDTKLEDLPLSSIDSYEKINLLNDISNYNIEDNSNNNIQSSNFNSVHTSDNSMNSARTSDNSMNGTYTSNNSMNSTYTSDNIKNTNRYNSNGYLKNNRYINSKDINSNINNSTLNYDSVFKVIEFTINGFKIKISKEYSKDFIEEINK